MNTLPGSHQYLLVAFCRGNFSVLCQISVFSRLFTLLFFLPQKQVWSLKTLCLLRHESHFLSHTLSLLCTLPSLIDLYVHPHLWITKSMKHTDKPFFFSNYFVAKSSVRHTKTMGEYLCTIFMCLRRLCHQTDQSDSRVGIQCTLTTWHEVSSLL